MSASAVMHPSDEHMYADELRYREASADPTTVPSHSEKASPRRSSMRCPTRSPACTVTQHRGSRAVVIGHAAWQIKLLDSMKTAYRSLNDPTSAGSL
jgi:hypothetical protein